MKTENLQELLPRVIDIACIAGDFIRRERARFEYSAVEIKGVNDMVSYVDRGSEEIIVKALQTLMPDSGFLVEENTASRTAEYNWIIDPLDGTTNFIHGITCFAVSIALEHKGDILLGVVYEVSRDECFSAIKGIGAFCNGNRISVSQRKTLKDSLVATGFPVTEFSRIGPFMKALEHFLRNTHGVRRIGAASADLCFVACGRVDAFFEYNLKPWDVAAGALIALEAGGRVTDFSDKQNWLHGKEIIANNGLLHEEMSAVIKRCFTD